MKTSFLSVITLICILLGSCRSNNEYHWVSTNSGMELKYGDHRIGTLLKPNEIQGITSTDIIETIENSLFKITRTYRVTETIDSVCLDVSFETNSASHYAMIPSVNYNGNNWGRGKEPKGFKYEGQWWTVSYRTTPIPGATYSEGDKYAVALWGENPARPEDAFSCSLRPEEQKTTHCLIYPEEEMPLCYNFRDHYIEGFRRKMSLNKGDSKTVVAYLHVSEVKPQHRALQTFLQKAWQVADHDLPTVPDPEKIWQLGIRYAKESLWVEEGSFKGINSGLLPDDNMRWIHWPYKGEKYAIGWTGQNASYSNSLLTDFLKTGDESSLEMGLACLDAWADNCVLPNGLFIIHYDYILKQMKEETLDACNLGTAALNFFEAADLAKQCGKERPAYEKVALGICRFVRDDQHENGVYGRGWTFDGECMVREGTVGCFLVPPMIEAYHRTNDRSFLESAIRAYNHYVEQLNEDGYTTAGALDTWCIDKESSYPLLRSALKLYHTTQDSRYLDDAVHISYYLSTWLWHYNGVYPPEDDLSRYGYQTYGATSVSTQHRHLDPYAVFWVSDWIMLSQLTGDPQWKEKAKAVWHNGCQLVSDGTLEINGFLRPAGSQNEGFAQCYWNYIGKTGFSPFRGRENDRINQWLVAWPGAFRLETLRRLPDWGIFNILSAGTFGGSICQGQTSDAKQMILTK
jgi:hypothetical protein